MSRSPGIDQAAGHHHNPNIQPLSAKAGKKSSWCRSQPPGLPTAAGAPHLIVWPTLGDESSQFSQVIAARDDQNAIGELDQGGVQLAPGYHAASRPLPLGQLGPHAPIVNRIGSVGHSLWLWAAALPAHSALGAGSKPASAALFSSWSFSTSLVQVAKKAAGSTGASKPQRMAKWLLSH